MVTPPPREAGSQWQRLIYILDNLIYYEVLQICNLLACVYSVSKMKSLRAPHRYILIPDIDDDQQYEQYVN